MQRSRALATSNRAILTMMMASMLLILSACGFKFRGLGEEVSFKSLYVQGSTLALSRDLTRKIRSNGVKIVDSIEEADLALDLINEINEKRIMSLSGGGLVREFELNYRINFRIRDPKNPLWGPVQTVSTRRDYSYDDTNLLAKDQEEARLNSDMRNDAIRELMRRLSAYKPANQ